MYISGRIFLGKVGGRVYDQETDCVGFRSGLGVWGFGSVGCVGGLGAWGSGSKEFRSAGR